MNLQRSLLLTTAAILGVLFAVKNMTGRGLQHSLQNSPEISPRWSLAVETVTQNKKTLSQEQTKNLGVLAILRQSSEIFQEVWGTLTEDRFNRKISVFKEVLGHLQKSYRDDGSSYSVFSCDRRAIIEEQQIKLISCQDSSVSSVTLAEIANFSAEAVEITFFSKHLPQGAGMSLSVLGQPIRCQFKMGEKFRLSHLSCKDLGQNLSGGRYARFEKFDFSADQEWLVDLKALIYKDLGNIEMTREMRVPLAGKILLKSVFAEEEILAIENETQIQKAESGETEKSEKSEPVPAMLPARAEAAVEEPMSEQIISPSERQRTAMESSEPVVR